MFEVYAKKADTMGTIPDIEAFEPVIRDFLAYYVGQVDLHNAYKSIAMVLKNATLLMKSEDTTGKQVFLRFTMAKTMQVDDLEKLLEASLGYYVHPTHLSLATRKLAQLIWKIISESK